MFKIENHTLLRCMPIHKLFPTVKLDAFLHSSNVRTVVENEETLYLDVPALRNIESGGPKLSGPVYLLPDIGKIPTTYPDEFIKPSFTISRLSDICCIPGQVAIVPSSSATIQNNPYVLMESLSDEWSRGSVTLTKVDNDNYFLPFDVDIKDRITGKYLYLDCMHGSHFGHFIVDIASILWAYDYLKSHGFSDLKVILSQNLTEYMKDLFVAFDIKPQDIVHLDKPAIVQEVFFATRSLFTQGYTSDTALRTWKKVRDYFDTGLGPERIYISRSKNSNRSMLNESEVEDLFRSLGFRIVYPEDMSFPDQVNIWANAVYVAGSAGSNMYGLAFQKNLKKCFIINSPNFLHLQEVFLQYGYQSKIDIFFGESEARDIHASWYVSIPKLRCHLSEWLESIQRSASARYDLSPRHLVIRPMGGFANRMIQLLAAHRIKQGCPLAEISHPELPDWSIRAEDHEAPVGRSVRFGDSRHRLDAEGIASCLARGVVDTVVIDSYAQHFDNFPDVALARGLFVTPPSLDHVQGFGPDRLVISVRGGEILDGRHPDYILLPPSFYDMVIAETGLQPVFFGQIEDNAYCLALRARFPRAEFVAGQGVMHDFAVLRRSCHIVPSISTFSWLAAWLSEAQTVHLPVAGLFNPRQARMHYLLPLDDARYRFYLFPLAYSADIVKDPQRFASMQRALDGMPRLVSASRMRMIIDNAPLVKRRIDAFLKFYDEDYYASAQGDIGAAVRDGLLPSALHHYLEHGFAEERPCFRLDLFHYSTRYPLAAAEVANGEYLDFWHHFVEIGHLRGYTATG